MPYLDLAFRLAGSKVLVNHGYALYSAMNRILPEIHEAKNIGGANKWFLTPFFRRTAGTIETGLCAGSCADA